MVEITFADNPQKFDCAECRDNVKALRRCEEDRYDFTHKDNLSVFPIYAIKGGTPFGFCPGKASWFEHIYGQFRMLVLSAETGKLPYDGGLFDQPDWVINLLGWFIPYYKHYQFVSRVKMVLGEEKKTMRGNRHGDNNRRVDSKNSGIR